MINWFFGVFCVILTFAWLQRRKKMKRLQERIPKGNMGWPLIGETLEFIASGHTSHPVSFMDKRKSLYGKVFKTNILGKPVIVSTDWEVNRVILQNDGRTFVPSYPKTVTELLGETSILKMSGSTQRKVHGLVGSFLKSPQFKKLITLETEKSLELNMKNWKEGQRILLQDAVQNVTSEILIRTLVGIGPGHEMNLLKQDFGIFLQGLICLPIKFPGTTLYKSLKAKERMMKLIMNILKKKTERNGSDPATSVLDVLLAERNDLEQILTDKCLCGNTIDFMIPGEESLPTLITLAMKYLSHYPLALQQLTEEHMKLKLEKKHSGEPYNWVDYMTLPFTQNVISETLRMANIVNAVWRESCEDVEIKGHFIPKGWCVLASFVNVHMDEENYENPSEFCPWRWQGKEGNYYNDFTPFGGGQRLCPGLEFSRLEAAIFLHHFITNYRWTFEEDDIIYFPTVRMKKRLPVTVSPISV